jgi:hypothetical protein
MYTINIQTSNLGEKQNKIINEPGCTVQTNTDDDIAVAR